MCHFDVNIILSWRKLRNCKHGKSFLTSPNLSKTGHNFPLLKMPPSHITKRTILFKKNICLCIYLTVSTQIPAAQFSSVTQSCPTICNTMNHSTLKLMSIESLMPSNNVILCCPLLLLLNLSQHQDLFKWVSPSHQLAGPNAMILVFWILSFKPTFSLSSFTFIRRLLSSSSLSAIRVVSSAYLKLLIFLPEILIPACASSSPAFVMMYSAYKLNKQGDNTQPLCTPFPIWNQSAVPCSVLTVASWPAYRFLRRQVR